MDKGARSKTQTLSLRLDPKTRFVLEFIAKVNRQSITTVVEDAIGGAAAAVTIGDRHHEFEERNWLHFWDVSEGVRTMKMLADPDMPTTYDDDELRDFMERHIEFFSENNKMTDPDRINVEILWPSIYEYLTTWRSTKHSTPFAVGAEMARALEAAGVEPPQWPRAKAPPPRTKNALADAGRVDLGADDEIPF